MFKSLSNPRLSGLLGSGCIKMDCPSLRCVVLMCVRQCCSCPHPTPQTVSNYAYGEHWLRGVCMSSMLHCHTPTCPPQTSTRVHRVPLLSHTANGLLASHIVQRGLFMLPALTYVAVYIKLDGDAVVPHRSTRCRPSQATIGSPCRRRTWCS
jgi:hypothetical protein